MDFCHSCIRMSRKWGIVLHWKMSIYSERNLQLQKRSTAFTLCTATWWKRQYALGQLQCHCIPFLYFKCACFPVFTVNSKASWEGGRKVRFENDTAYILTPIHDCMWMDEFYFWKAQWGSVWVYSIYPYIHFSQVRMLQLSLNTEFKHSWQTVNIQELLGMF